ncbi:hypothetical protein ACLKA6_010141 [Drosophila palustris]
MGKANCSPIKALSVPRLELQAAVLGVRLKNAILANHQVYPKEVHLWSDSKTVINWIHRIVAAINNMSLIVYQKFWKVPMSPNGNGFLEQKTLPTSPRACHQR